MSITSLQAGKIICEMSGWETSSLRLQKLLYVAHLFYVGRNEGKPLIKEDFEAWRYGPVEPNLYRYCRGFGADYIKNIFPLESGVPSESGEYKMLKETVEDTIGIEGRNRITESALIGFTHWKEGAWYNAYHNKKRGFFTSPIIPLDAIKKEYVDRGLNKE